MPKQMAIVAGFATIVWALSSALIGVGRELFGLDGAMILHGIGTPLGAAALAFAYRRFFGVCPPLVTAAVFVAGTVLLHAIVVVAIFGHPATIFANVVGFWLPMALVFAAAAIAGLSTQRPKPA